MKGGDKYEKIKCFRLDCNYPCYNRRFKLGLDWCFQAGSGEIHIWRYVCAFKDYLHYRGIKCHLFVGHFV